MTKDNMRNSQLNIKACSVLVQSTVKIRLKFAKENQFLTIPNTKFILQYLLQLSISLKMLEANKSILTHLRKLLSDTLETV